MSETAGRVADATGNWVDRLAPASFRPYLRLARFDRPIGAWLLLLPCWWSAALAALHDKAPFPSPWHLVLFFIGAFVMRGCGCTWNDIVDRNIDAQVGMKSTALLFGARTKPILSAFYGAAVSLFGFAGWNAGAGILFASGLAGFAAHLAWQIWRLDIDDPDRCLALFKSNRDAGLILFGGLLLDAVWNYFI